MLSLTVALCGKSNLAFCFVGVSIQIRFTSTFYVWFLFGCFFLFLYAPSSSSSIQFSASFSFLFWRPSCPLWSVWKLCLVLATTYFDMKFNFSTLAYIEAYTGAHMNAYAAVKFWTATWHDDGIYRIRLRPIGFWLFCFGNPKWWPWANSFNYGWTHDNFFFCFLVLFQLSEEHASTEVCEAIDWFSCSIFVFAP